LQTRYYDAEVGRFLNADDVKYLNPKRILGCNLYCYCLNNPVSNIDKMGTDSNEVFKGILLGLVVITCAVFVGIGGGLAAIGAAALVCGGLNAISAAIPDENGETEDIATAFLCGALTGAALAVAPYMVANFGAIGFIGASALTFGVGCATYVVETSENNKDFVEEHMWISGATTMAHGWLGIGMGALFKNPEVVPENKGVIETIGEKIIQNPCTFLIDILSATLAGEEISPDMLIDFIGGFLPW